MDPFKSFCFFGLVFGWLLPGLAFGQSPVSGRVVAASGVPLPGAVVRVQGAGTAAGTVATDSLGYFKLQARSGRFRLVTSFVGYATDTTVVAVPPARPLLIVLQPAQHTLPGVTVSTGYQDIPAERATGSFVQLDRALLNRSVSTDIISRLQDVVPGLSFNPVGTQLSIRGQSTLFSNADPLVVVDGFPYNQPVSSLNPADVANVSVLKDAAAASIWGSRAGNGVIVVTTRKGAYNQPLRVSLNSSLQWLGRPDLYYQRRMSSADYIGIEKHLFGEGYFDALEQADGHPALSPAVELLIAQRDGAISAQVLEQQLAALAGLDVRRDLSRYFQREGLNQQYQLGLDGGSLNQRYFFSAGLDHNVSNAVGNSFQRVTVSGGNSWSLADRRLELSAAFYLSENTTVSDNTGALSWSGGQPLYPYAALADARGEALAVTHDYRLAFPVGGPAAGPAGLAVSSAGGVEFER